MKYLGCAYYPEYWGRERVLTDARLMRAAGINIARIGEFAWCRMEPEDGRFTLDWLHEAVATLGRHGIDVLMCTPTAAPPAWLTSAYPDVLMVSAEGRRSSHGGRRHYCSSSDTYRRLSARITEVLAREMAIHKNVIGWQLDNEFGPESGWCHCENCQARFQAWLREQYGTLAELNRRWGTGFWSMDYSDWRQVRLADKADVYASRSLDSKRFWSGMMTDYALSQAAILRRLHPKALVTTNGMGPLFSPMDYYRLFAALDVACDDLYFDIATQDANVCAMNVYRSYKAGHPYWITETGSGALDHGKPPHPGQFRAWAWSNLAHGGEAHFVFRWRTCLSGQEQELRGILEHSGKPRHRYRAVRKCFRELRQLWPKLKDLPLPKASVAIMHDYNVMWGYEASRPGRGQNYTGQSYQEINYPNLILRIHKALYDRQITPDIVPPGRDLKGYRLVILPSLVMIAPEFAAQLKAFVRSGGLVLALGQIGMRDFNDSYLSYAGPDHLQDLLGVTLEGGMYLRSHVGPDEALWVPAAKCRETEVALGGSLDGQSAAGKAQKWIGDLELNGGEALLRFADDAYAGQPAVVSRRTGKGRSLYAAASSLDDALFGQLLEFALKQARIRRGPRTPDYVEVVRRGNMVFAVNHRAEAVQVNLGTRGRVLVGACRDGVADLPPYGVCVAAVNLTPDT
jgi:beta-galactosidase